MSQVSSAFAVVLLLAASGSAAAEHAAPPSISVSGRAELSAPPDFAEFAVQVISRRGDATDAAADNATRSAAVMRALRGAVGDAGTLRTESFSVSPEYRYKSGEQTLIGYVASHSIGVELTDLASVGKVTGAALEAGADTIANLQITLKDDTGLRAEALALASSRARAKANAIANSLGLKVLRVLDVSEDAAGRIPQPMYRQAVQMESASASAPPITTGPVRIEASVQLRVEVAD